MDSAADGSLHLNDLQSSFSHSGGHNSIGFASISPIAPTCASICISPRSGLMIAAAATRPAVNRAEDDPPPLKSAWPSVLMFMTIS